MKTSEEYQIFIGCHDAQINNELVKDYELSDIISNFFMRNEVDFSLLKMAGGYLYKDGTFVFENGVIISIVGAKEKEVVKLGKILSKYMNQESSLIIKNIVGARIL